MTLALVVPCKDEYRRLDIAAFLDAIREFPWLTFLFVDDGSTDDTAETLAFLTRESPAIQALYLPHNVGKAEAVRAGVQKLLAESRADWIGYWDADLATPLAELAAFRDAFERHPDAQAVLGARWPHLGGQIDRTFFRNATGLLMKSLIRCVLHAPAYDTQCDDATATGAPVSQSPIETTPITSLTNLPPGASLRGSVPSCDWSQALSLSPKSARSSFLRNL